MSWPAPSRAWACSADLYSWPPSDGPARFPSAGSFRRYSGLAPKASETGNSDSKGQPMSKAGASWLRDQLVMSANVARKIDPELARIYYVQMVERGAHHNKALCIVAAHLAGRAWTTLRRGTPYVLRDIDGTEVTVAEGKAIVAERYQVPEEVRRRRRTKKAGKVPHEVPMARSGRGDPPRISSIDRPTFQGQGPYQLIAAGRANRGLTSS